MTATNAEAASARPDAGFLGPPPASDGAAAMFESDVAGDGYVMNLTRVWAHRPDAQPALAALLDVAATGAGLTPRQRGLLVCASAAARSDAYCSLAWGAKLAEVAGAEVAAAVLVGDDHPDLADGDRALVRWARQLGTDANATTPADVAALRDAGFDDGQILDITRYVALRIAFSTVNDALGARPDHQLADAAPEPVRGAVTFGRPVAEGDR